MSMKPSEIYSDEIRLTGFSVLTGKLDTTISMAELLADEVKTPKILRLWCLDNDLQQITIASTNLGFSRTYQKSYKAAK